MLAFTFSFLLGQLLSGAWVPPWWSVLAACLVWGFVLARAPRLELVLRCVSAVAAGALLVAWATSPPKTGCTLPPPGEPLKRWLEAEVIDATVSSVGEIGLRVKARLGSGPEPRELCGFVWLTIVGLEDEPWPEDRLRLHASLRRPRNFGNPGAYDYEGALARRRVWVTGFARAANVMVVARNGRGWRARLARDRARIRELIRRSLSPDDASLMRALVLGEAAAMPRELRDAISRAGLAHLLSVSGLHVALVWGIGFGVLRWLGSRSERVLLRIDVRTAAAVGALPLPIAYAALAGSSLPTERAVAMSLLAIVAMAVSREIAPLRVLSLAALAISVLHPGSPLDISFQLSFLSVLALFAGASRLRVARDRLPEERSRLRERVVLIIGLSGAALAGTAPLVAFHFNWVTPIGIVTNPLLVPLCGFPATVLGLAGAVTSWASDWGAERLFTLGGWPLVLLRVSCRAAAALPGASCRVPTPTLAELSLLYAVFALPWLPRRGRAWLFGLLLVLGSLDVAWWVHERFLDSRLRLRFLDVGQGDAMVLELPHGRVMVVDAGGFHRSRFDPGERVVAPYLWSRKVLRVQALVSTHSDWDHRGGLGFLAREFRPQELWRSELPSEREPLVDLERLIEASGGRVRTASTGAVLWSDGRVAIECLHPPAHAALDGNDASVVLRVRAGSTSILLTGDIEDGAEHTLVESGFGGPVSVLKVPHHGSLSSSTDRFLRAFAPEVAVVSAGAGNPFGHPRPEVLARYRRRGARVLRTDQDGAIWIATDARGLTVRTFRDGRPSFCGVGVVC